MRFALQKHTTSSLLARPTHLDLMLQSKLGKSLDDRYLITFEIPLEPTYWGGALFRRLEPHRLVYLDYSGEIGGQRGSVERIDSGNLEWVSQKDQELIFSMNFSAPTYQKNSGLWRFTQSTDMALWHAEHIRSPRASGDSPE